MRLLTFHREVMLFYKMLLFFVRFRKAKDIG